MKLSRKAEFEAERDLRGVNAYPEIISSSRPDFVSVAESGAHQPRPKVTGEVDGVSGLPSETSTDAKDHEEETEGGEVARAQVAVVIKGVDEKHQDCAFGYCQYTATLESDEDVEGRSERGRGSILAMTSEKNMPVLVMKSAG